MIFTIEPHMHYISNSSFVFTWLVTKWHSKTAIRKFTLFNARNLYLISI